MTLLSVEGISGCSLDLWTNNRICCLFDPIAYAVFLTFDANAATDRQTNCFHMTLSTIGMQRWRWTTGPPSTSLSSTGATGLTGVTRSFSISLIIYRPAVHCFIAPAVHWYDLHSFFKIYLRVVLINLYKFLGSIQKWFLELSKPILSSFSMFLDLFVSSMDATKTVSHRFTVTGLTALIGPPFTGDTGETGGRWTDGLCTVNVASLLYNRGNYI
jgi:hypothetical protein